MQDYVAEVDEIFLLQFFYINDDNLYPNDCAGHEALVFRSYLMVS